MTEQPEKTERQRQAEAEAEAAEAGIRTRHRREDERTLYTREELMLHAQGAFGVQPEVVAGAMALLGKDLANREEVAAAVEQFLKREV